MWAKKHVEGMLWLTAFLCPLLATQTSVRACLMMIAVIWAGSIVTVVPLHFWRAWRRLGSVLNKREYAVWVGFETLGACGIAGFVFSAVAR
ncbi:MAG TPA: hypothetical protein VKA07_10475 [Candidatus Sulfotelmatobacter sp.]|nr:hypothetical protein [Candidatus Sulfotelmatobacter sp.]